MKTNTKRFGNHKWTALVTALALAVTLILPVSRSYAAPDTDGPVDLTKAVALTVIPAGDDEMKLDLSENAELEIDLYKIADAVGYDGSDGYTYSALDPFRSLESQMKNIDITAADWQQIAQAAADIVLVKNTSEVQSKRITIAPNTKVETFNSGLYLVIAHGKGMTVEEYVTTMPEDDAEASDGDEDQDEAAGALATMAKSTSYDYYFLPELVSLPGSYVKTEDESSTMSLSPWNYDVTITLKPKRELGVGPLRIVKQLDTYENHNETTFVFQVEIMDSDPETNPKAQKIYSSAVSISFNAPGTKTLEIDNLPLGAVATVSEVYTGEDYKLVEGSKVQTTVISLHEEEDASGNTVELIYGEVNYRNDYNGTTRGGGSIENRFSHTGDEGASWQWEGVRDDGKIYGIAPAPAPAQ